MGSDFTSRKFIIITPVPGRTEFTAPDNLPPPGSSSLPQAFPLLIIQKGSRSQKDDVRPPTYLSFVGPAGEKDDFVRTSYLYDSTTRYAFFFLSSLMIISTGL